MTKYICKSCGDIHDVRIDLSKEESFIIRGFCTECTDVKKPVSVLPKKYTEFQTV